MIITIDRLNLLRMFPVYIGDYFTGAIAMDFADAEGNTRITLRVSKASIESVLKLDQSILMKEEE